MMLVLILLYEEASINATGFLFYTQDEWRAEQERRGCTDEKTLDDCWSNGTDKRGTKYQKVKRGKIEKIAVPKVEEDSFVRKTKDSEATPARSKKIARGSARSQLYSSSPVRGGRLRRSLQCSPRDDDLASPRDDKEKDGGVVAEPHIGTSTGVSGSESSNESSSSEHSDDGGKDGEAAVDGPESSSDEDEETKLSKAEKEMEGHLEIIDGAHSVVKRRQQVWELANATRDYITTLIDVKFTVRLCSFGWWTMAMGVISQSNGFQLLLYLFLTF